MKKKLVALFRYVENPYLCVFCVGFPPFSLFVYLQINTILRPSSGQTPGMSAGHTPRGHAGEGRVPGRDPVAAWPGGGHGPPHVPQGRPEHRRLRRDVWRLGRG